MTFTTLARALAPIALVATPSLAAAPSPDLARLKAHLSAVQTMTANFTQTESTTNDQGQVKALVSIGTDRSNRIITIKAKAAELNAEASFAVTGARLSGTPSLFWLKGTLSRSVWISESRCL